MSLSVPPMELRQIYARTPNVDGKSHDTPCQKPDILACGHEAPLRKSSGMLTNTMSSITFSR